LIRARDPAVRSSQSSALPSSYLFSVMALGLG
jgi:hypothetical protein